MDKIVFFFEMTEKVLTSPEFLYITLRTVSTEFLSTVWQGGFRWISVMENRRDEVRC